MALNRYHNETCHHIYQWHKLCQYESITELLEKEPILETTLQSTYKSDKKDFND
jgi:hypothetical protein